MSAGPIAAERAGHVVPLVSTPDAHRVCAAGADPGRGYCGRKTKTPADWKRVTCNDCKAARRADLAAEGTN